MAVERPNSGNGRQVPRDDTRQASKEAPKKPQDNTAAKQAPKETKTALNNAFGKTLS